MIGFRSGDVGDAVALLRRGALDGAAAAAHRRLVTAPGDAAALRVAGTVALWRNQLDEATAWLERAGAARPRDRRVAALAAETHRRAGRWVEAARLFARAGHAARARQLAGCGSAGPCAIAHPEAVAIRLLQVDPLPLVEVAIDGATAVALVDTGGGDLIVDTDLAARLALPAFGRTRGTFSGGARRGLEHSRIARFRLGALLITDVPTLVTPIRRLLTAADGRGLDAVIGTTLLARFRTTVDYPGGELRLTPTPATGGSNDRNDDRSDDLSDDRSDDRGAGETQVPFWLVDDHFVVAPGRLNADVERPFAIDTGLGGCALAASDAVHRAAGIQAPAPRWWRRPVPHLVPIDRLAIGGVEQHGLRGMTGVFPAALPDALGLALAGLVGHEFVRRWRLTFDFERMRLTFAAAATGPGC